MTTDTTTKDWKQQRERRRLTLSASQIATGHLCVRKWWLERVRKLSVPEDTSKFTFGSVFHATVERYLLADDRGRDRKTGKAVDLFPEGWTQDINKFSGQADGQVNEEEAGIIKALVEKGIESGVLAPYPDRKVEQEFRFPVGKIDGVTVDIMGFIDCVSRTTVIDHKTSSSPRWFQSAQSLAKDIQMLLYAKVLLEDHRQKGESPDKIVLRHNQFCKNPEKGLEVRATEVSVTSRFVDQFWANTILPTVEKMVRFRDKANSWAEMPEPETRERACNKYGGCNYMNICSGRITEATLEKRLLSLDATAQPVILTTSATAPNDKGQKMGNSMADKLAAIKAKKNAAAQDEPVEEPKAEAPKKESPAAEAPELPEGMVRPPWANPNCKACLGVGFNTVGNVCKVCDMKADSEVKSKNFKVEGQKDGSFIWQHKEDEEIVGQSPGTSYGREEPKETEQKTKDVEADVEEDKPKTKAPTSPAKAKEEDGDDKKELDTNSFSLYINCRPLKTGRGLPKPVDLHDLLEEARTQLAEASEVDSFYDLDPFKRKDRIASLAPQVADMVGKGNLVATGVSTGLSEIRVLLDALRPLAKQVIVADAN